MFVLVLAPALEIYLFTVEAGLALGAVLSLTFFPHIFQLLRTLDSEFQLLTVAVQTVLSKSYVK